MVNKKFCLGILVIILVFGILIVSCDDSNSTDSVRITIDKPPQVNSVIVTKTTNNQYFIISWDAVQGEMSGYTVLFKQDGKNSYTSVSGVQNVFKYDPANGDQIVNDNLDKWSCRVSDLSNLASASGSYCFGVRTTSAGYIFDVNYSDIKWSTPFTLTAGPQMSTVSLIKTTNESYLIASWDAVSGIDAYNITLYYKSGSGWGRYTSAAGQNSLTFAESDGNSSINADPSKWSYRYSNYLTSYPGGCYWAVTPVSSDISILPSPPASSNIVY